MNGIRQYLESVAEMHASFHKTAPEDFLYISMEEFLLKNGREWPVSAAQVFPGAYHAFPQQCFDNSYRLARMKKGYRYVEGIAMSIIPTHHAWVVTADGEVLDPTWVHHTNHGVGSEYFGVEIPLPVMKQVRHKNNLAAFYNHRGLTLFREPWVDIIANQRVSMAKNGGM